MRGSRRSLIHLIPLFSSRPLIHSILKKKQNELDTKRPKMKSILPEDTGTSPKPLWPTPQVKVSKYIYHKILSIDELPYMFIYLVLTLKCMKSSRPSFNFQELQTKVLLRLQTASVCPTKNMRIW